MGMQVHWDIKNVPSYAIVEVSGIETSIKIEGERTVYVDNANEGCWFDCGFMSDYAMRMITWLIKHRIPFNAS